jgi:hypothetical protein
MSDAFPPASSGASTGFPHADEQPTERLARPVGRLPGPLDPATGWPRAADEHSEDPGHPPPPATPTAEPASPPAPAADTPADGTAVLSLDDLMGGPPPAPDPVQPVSATPVAPVAPASVAPAPIAPPPPAPAPASVADPAVAETPVPPPVTEPPVTAAAPRTATTPPHTAPARRPARQPSVDWVRIRTDATAAYAAGLRRGQEWITAADNALIVAMIAVAVLLLVVVGAH